MVSIEKYADLIKSLPVGGQFTKIKKDSKFWDPTKTEFSDDVKEVVKTVFKECSGDEKYINISRDDIKNTEGTEKKIVKILMWGYPGGGRYGQVQNILQNLEDLTACLEEINHNSFDSVQDALGNVLEIHGLGLSTISKLLYFLNNPSIF